LRLDDDAGDGLQGTLFIKYEQPSFITIKILTTNFLLFY